MSSIIQFFLLYSNVLCTFNKKNERKGNSSDLQSPHKGRLFYLCVLLSAPNVSHTGENWHCDFQFVREAGWFHIPTETGCLPLSFMKYKSQIRAWRLRYCKAHAEGCFLFLLNRTCNARTQASTWAHSLWTHKKSSSCIPSSSCCPHLTGTSACPYLPLGLSATMAESVYRWARAALMTQLVLTWHGAIVHITDN